MKKIPVSYFIIKNNFNLRPSRWSFLFYSFNYQISSKYAVISFIYLHMCFWIPITKFKKIKFLASKNSVVTDNNILSCNF